MWAVNEHLNAFPPMDYGRFQFVVGELKGDIVKLKKDTNREFHYWTILPCWCICADLSLILIRYIKLKGMLFQDLHAFIFIFITPITLISAGFQFLYCKFHHLKIILPK